MVTSARGEVTRYTDRRTMDHFLMAYCGLVNKRLVEALRREGADAVGLSAMDGGHRDRPAQARSAHRRGRPPPDPPRQPRRQHRAPRPLPAPPPPRHRPAPGADAPRHLRPGRGDQRRRRSAGGGGGHRAGRGAPLDPDERAGAAPRPRRPVEPRSRASARSEIETHLPLARGRARVKLLAARRALEGGVAAVVLGDGRGRAAAPPRSRAGPGPGSPTRNAGHWRPWAGKRKNSGL